MSPRFSRFLLLALAFACLPLLVAGCGAEEPELDVPEGEPLELGGLEFDVQITRFLNPDSPEDSAYLEGAPPLVDDQQYLGVFMEIKNEGDEETVVPYPLKVVDTNGETFIQDDIDNDFTLEPGTPVPPDGQVPEVQTAAANGPIEGSLVLFPLDETANEDRPLKLEVPGPEGAGEIELDL